MGYDRARAVTWIDDTPIFGSEMEHLEQAIYGLKTTVYYATDFGSAFDDVTLQAMLTQARTSGGGLCVVTPGTWTTTADLVIGSNTTLWLMPGATIKRQATTATVAVIKNYDRTFGGTDTDIRIVGEGTIWRDGEATTPNTPYDNAIYMKGVTRPVVEGIRVRGAAKGVHMEGCLWPETFVYADGFVDNAVAYTWTGSAFVSYGSIRGMFGAPSASGYSLGSSSVVCTCGGVKIGGVFKDAASNIIELGDLAAGVSIDDVVAKWSGAANVSNTILAQLVDDLTIRNVNIEQGNVVVAVNTPASDLNHRVDLSDIHVKTGIIAVRNVAGGSLRDFSTYGSNQVGIDIASCSDFELESGDSHGHDNSGVYIHRNGSGPTNANVTARNVNSYANGKVSSAGDTYGFFVDLGDKVGLEHCRAYDDGSGKQTHGLYVNATTNFRDIGNNFAGNATAPRAAFTGAYTYAALPLSGLAGDELGYTEFTSPVNVTVTTEATAVSVVTAPAIVFDGNPVWVEFGCPYVQTPNVASSEALVLVLWDNTAGVSLGKMALLQNGSPALIYQPGNARRKLTPAVGSRTYSIRAYVSNAAGGNVGAGSGAAGNFLPGFIRVTRA